MAQPCIDSADGRFGGMRFETEDDFDLDKIAGSGQCFRWKKEADGGYRIIASGRILHIRKEGNSSRRTGSSGTHGGVFGLSCTEKEFHEFWHSYFDLDEDYRQLRAGIPAGDRYLRRAAETEAGVRILRQDLSGAGDADWLYGDGSGRFAGLRLSSPGDGYLQSWISAAISLRGGAVGAEPSGAAWKGRRRVRSFPVR